MTDSHRDHEAAEAWSSSGLAALTGRRHSPAPSAPRALVEGVAAWAGVLAERSGTIGSVVSVDPLGLLAERAALTGLVRGGDVSCGGGSRLLPSADGWVAVSLTRPDDWDLVAAWLGRLHPVVEGAWDTVAAGVADASCEQLRDGAVLLGLPVAVLGERDARGNDADPDPLAEVGWIRGIRAQRIGSAPASTTASELVVLDLSSLWAGPLAGRLLLESGARVVKVESVRRPDGARLGPPRFFSRLNAGKASVALDLTSAVGRHHLRDLVAAADVVITASRPRAFEQLGIYPVERVGEGRTRVWLSITGYGLGDGSQNRVAFGDDAAVAGGLVVWDDRGPCFCADAVADPLAGLASAAAVYTALTEGGTWVLDASMADVAGGLTGPPVPLAGRPARPPSEPADGTPAVARALGADTEAVLSSLATA